MSDWTLSRAYARGISTAALLASVGCHQTPPVSLPPAPVLPPIAQIEPPAPRDAAAPAIALSGAARGSYVDVDTHGADVDVRILLDLIARAGGFSLVYSPAVNRKIRLTLNDVPVATALETVLSLAGLTLETTTPGMKLPDRPRVVFYELPVNVDSLSAGAIMERFGVSRPVAEMIVQSRIGKP